MNILHYSLGLPPYRTGGLTKYATDLMEEQSVQGNNVFLLWPGRMGIIKKKIQIKSCKMYNGINTFEIINPLPVPLLNGIKEYEIYTRNTDIGVYEKFLKNNSIDILHIHTFMGMHLALLQAAKKMKIKMIYTAHDYFGICPKVNLFNYKGENCNCPGETCEICNQNALSMKKIIIMQSMIYRMFKDTYLVRKLRAKKNEEMQIMIDKKHSILLCDYALLLRYYQQMYSYIDVFHFNSKQTLQIYIKYISVKSYEIIPVIHKKIEDNRRYRKFSTPVRIAFMGGKKNYKGYNDVVLVSNELKKTFMNEFTINIYGAEGIDNDVIKYHGFYKENQLAEIYNKTDVVIVPSLCKETFGLVVLEAMSYGVPVMVSDCVGAKDLIKIIDENLIFHNKDEMKILLEKIIKEVKYLEKINMKIMDMDQCLFNYDEHVKKIEALYMSND